MKLIFVKLKHIFARGRGRQTTPALNPDDVRRGYIDFLERKVAFLRATISRKNKTIRGLMKKLKAQYAVIRKIEKDWDGKI